MFDSSPLPPIHESTRAGRHWRFAADHATSIEGAGLDWFRLVENDGARLVKRNTQRDVWWVRAGGREYFAKFYHPNGWVARLKLRIRGAAALREWEVGRYAAAHAIATVVPVATAWSGPRGGASLLVTQAVPDAEPLNDCWLAVRADRRQADGLADSLARLIARAHQCGFEHGDMHPGNILVRRAGHRYEAFFVDLHNVRVGRSVSQHKVVANLAQLNQWFRSYASRTQRLRFLRHYLAFRDQFAQASPFARNWSLGAGRLVALLHAQAERHANRLWAKRDRRIYRTGRYFTRLRPASQWRGHALLRCKHPAPTAGASRIEFSRRQWEEWLADPAEWVNPERHQLLKDSHTATLCLARLPAAPEDATVVVKRCLARNPWKRLWQVLGPSRNRRAWTMANMLRNRNLPAAQPLALVERFALGLFRMDSILFTEFIPGSVDLETFLTREVAALPPSAQREVKNRLIDTVAVLLRQFHERGFAHRDLKAPNLLVTWPAPYHGRPQLTLIDMEGIRHVGRPSERQRLRAVVRLCASLLSSPACTTTDRLRFLLRFLLGPGRTADQWKHHWRWIHREVCEKLGRKQVRREWKLAHYGRE